MLDTVLIDSDHFELSFALKKYVKEGQQLLSAIKSCMSCMVQSD